MWCCVAAAQKQPASLSTVTIKHAATTKLALCNPMQRHMPQHVQCPSFVEELLPNTRLFQRGSCQISGPMPLANQRVNTRCIAPYPYKVTRQASPHAPQASARTIASTALQEVTICLQGSWRLLYTLQLLLTLALAPPTATSTTWAGCKRFSHNRPLPHPGSAAPHLPSCTL
jgi:hypothetical protein